MSRSLTPFVLAFCLAATLLASSQEQRKQPTISVTARLAAAKKAFLRNAGGNDIPYKVIESSLTAWGRFTLVDDREKADIIIDVAAPYDDSSIVMSSVASTSPLSGDQHSATATRQLYVPKIALTVSDAKSNVSLWNASERTKYSVKEKTRQDNMVEASQRLFSKLRDRIEPPAAQ